MTEDYEIKQGDCIDEMQAMDPGSIHAVVTDPPYGMAFMPGINDWDEFDAPTEYQEWCEEWAVECLRVLKPGGHLIAFSGSRTEHRLKTGVEDAGFEIRDTITWHYGEGFGAGKSQSVTNWMDDEDDIREWSGFKLGLKPATEFAVLARKPCDRATYQNVLEHGTGALNIDEARIPTEEDVSLSGGGRRSDKHAHEGYTRPWMEDESHVDARQQEYQQRVQHAEENGRYPSNLCLDSVTTSLLDEQSGREDSDAPSRFFYCAKPSPGEQTINGQVPNDHSTVKPLDLMEWLVTLVTAPGQRVLDPFAGSGTTIMACRRLGRVGVGVEKSEEYAELARNRVELAYELETGIGKPEIDDNGENRQSGLDAFADGGDAQKSEYQ